MGPCQTRKPRGFHHVCIYCDARKERLKAIEERAARELGLMPPERFEPGYLRGAFAGGSARLRRGRGGAAGIASGVPTGVLLFAIVALVALLRWLL